MTRDRQRAIIVWWLRVRMRWLSPWGIRRCQVGWAIYRLLHLREWWQERKPFDPLHFLD